MSIAAESKTFTISQLSAAVQAYFSLGISAATKKAYTAGLRKYITFCMEINQQPIPVCEDILLLFITHLAQQKLSYATIQVYLSAVQYSHITTSGSTILRTPRLNYVLKGICKTCAINHQPRERQPVTFHLWSTFTLFYQNTLTITRTSFMVFYQNTLAIINTS